MTDYLHHRERVRPDWVDATGALAPAYLVVIFDHAIDLLYNGIGIGMAYRQSTSFSSFTLETHTLIEGPVRADEEVLVRNRVLQVDTKRLHIAQEMFQPTFPLGRMQRVALMEQLSIHVDLSSRRSAPFPPERLAQIRAAIAAQAHDPPPVGVGQQVSLALS